ncbi:hypothetical protein BASA83_001400 [Batrachochytrium salamandrivorans]|nr:hypothetical protein BASA83_001400 [Batrachochytrium salamandrivorans]
MLPTYSTAVKQPKFSHGLFDCFSDCSTFVLSFCCPCILYGKNQQRAHNKEGCCLDACLYCASFSFYLQPVVGWYGRSKIRDATNISNDETLTDLLTHFCCASCALTQEKRELDAAGK